jgi:16S rRNA processing protein RimM
LTDSTDKSNGEKGLAAVGRIVAAHGLHGELKVALLTDSPERFRVMRTLFVFGGGSEETEPHQIESLRRMDRQILIKLRGVDDRNAAESLKGRFLGIPQDQRKPLPDDSFYPDQLIGLSAETEKGIRIGTVKDVLAYPAQNLLAVDCDGREVLIPMVKEIIKKVDLTSGKVVIDSIEGLF